MGSALAGLALWPSLNPNMGRGLPINLNAGPKCQNILMLPNTNPLASLTAKSINQLGYQILKNASQDRAIFKSNVVL